MALELEGIWIKYFQSIPVTPIRGNHPRSHTCNRKACVWALSENDGVGLVRVAWAFGGFNRLKDCDLPGCSLWMRRSSLVWRSESRGGSQHSEKVGGHYTCHHSGGKEKAFNLKLSATGCTGCFHLSYLISFSPQSWEVIWRGSLKRSDTLYSSPLAGFWARWEIRQPSQ